jgi:ribose 5-phosphate isomerase B
MTQQNPTYRIAIGADHAALDLKAILKEHLEAQGHTVEDFGTHTTASVDYPDFAHPVCSGVEAGTFDYGILLCGSGIGMSMAANKHQGIRAALIHNTELAALTREHNDANVLCMGARFTAPYHATMILDTFLTTAFAGGNHSRRLGKLGC